MRRPLNALAALAALLPLAAGPAAAQDAAAADTPVAVCDSLVALRQLAAEAGEDHARALAKASDQPGCRTVPRSTIGAVERRAMFGGAPYECFATSTGSCLWVLP